MAAFALTDLKKYVEFVRGLKGDQVGLFAEYVAIRRMEGANWTDIIAEVIAHLPDIIAFITAIVSLFKTQQTPPAQAIVAAVAKPATLAG
jgi:hypothetical protein